MTIHQLGASGGGKEGNEGALLTEAACILLPIEPASWVEMWRHRGGEGEEGGVKKGVLQGAATC